MRRAVAVLLFALIGVALAQDAKKKAAATVSNNIVPTAGAVTLANGNGDLLPSGELQAGCGGPH